MQLSTATILSILSTAVFAQQFNSAGSASSLKDVSHSTSETLASSSSFYVSDYPTTLVTLTKTAFKEAGHKEIEKVSTAYDSSLEKATSSAAFSSVASTASSSSSSSLTNGTATYYSVSADNCGTSSSDSDFVCAISKQLYDSVANSESISSYCGKSINVHYKSKTITVKVVDSCESCDASHIDLSPSAFEALDSLDVGVLDITWSWA